MRLSRPARVKKLLSNMTEDVITFGSQKSLYGIIHNPQQGSLNNKNILILFLHGWAGYRTGPHDMFVKLARNLCKRGFYCLRFDFGGKGYSRATADFIDTRSMLIDLQTVLTEVEAKLNIDKIVLLGICSGSNVGINYAMYGNYEIDNLIELSAPNLWKENNSSSEIRKVKNNSIEYFKKLMLVETWQKLFSNSLNYKNIFAILFRPLKVILIKSFNLSVKKNEKFDIEALDQLKTKPFSNFKGELFAIHGEKDPDTPKSTEQIKKICNQFLIPCHINIIRNANHSFYSIKWEQEIFSIIENWLLKKYNT